MDPKHCIVPWKNNLKQQDKHYFSNKKNPRWISRLSYLDYKYPSQKFPAMIKFVSKRLGFKTEIRDGSWIKRIEIYEEGPWRKKECKQMDSIEK